MSSTRTVATPHGEARLLFDRARTPLVTLLLGHGAGGGPDTPDLTALARQLPRHGVTVIRLEQPWRLAGRRVAPAPKVLDEALVAVADRLRPRTPLVLGGRSAGARCAARTAHHLGASGVLALSFPLHPPGRPERSRLEELTGVRVPSLVVQGELDPFGGPEEFPEGQPLVAVPGADHSLALSRAAQRRTGLSAADALGIVVAAALELVQVAAGNRRPPRGVAT